ncbi:MAG: aminotransferase class V-fold PLP-dependent enzyme, partial [Myxococcota bacterium]
MLPCRADFPILQRLVHGKPLVYLDNAATTQKPRCVLQAMTRFYQEQCAGVHRATHALSEEATQLYEQARARCATFLGAASADEIVFVRGATEGMNLLAHGLGQQLQSGDEVVVSVMEHHSGFLPWQRVCAQRGAHLRIAPMTDAGELDLEALRKLIGPQTRVVSLVHVSHVLGTVNPIEQVARWAHEQGAVLVVDGAQAV